MLGDALSYPRNSSDWIPTILIGGILTVLGFLILPVFVVQGYEVRVLRSAAKGEGAAPSFTDWGDLVIDGLKLFVIGLGYVLVVFVPFVVATFALFGISSVVAGPTTGEPNAAVGIVGFLVLALTALSGLFVGYVAPAGFTNFAVEDSMTAAFDVSTIASAATTGEYFKAWLLALVVAVVLGLVGTALSALVVGIFVLFYAQVVIYYLFGRGFAEGLGRKRRNAAETRF